MDGRNNLTVEIKLRFQTSPVWPKTQSQRFQLLRVEERFRKVPFSVDGRPNRRNKAAFSNSSGLKSVFEKLRFRAGLV